MLTKGWWAILGGVSLTTVLVGVALASPSGVVDLLFWRNVPSVIAHSETAPTPSDGDSADDSAIWVNSLDPQKSLILTTDKWVGIITYALDGSIFHSLNTGRLNNIDIRQNIELGDWRGDLVVASNRGNNSIDLFSIDHRGPQPLAAFNNAVEPYGVCLGRHVNETLVFVTHKSGLVKLYQLNSIDNNSVNYTLLASHQFSSTVEGCAFDDDHGQLYVGEENIGLWQLPLSRQPPPWQLPATLIGPIGQNGIAEDLEGVTVFNHQGQGYVLASSQGNNSYAVFKRGSGEFINRFRVGENDANQVDQAQETDGLAAYGSYLNEDFPDGLLVVQDGINEPRGSNQNFKLVDWRKVKQALALD